MTMIIGALAPLILPQSPETSRVLTDREKFIAAERLRIEHKANSHEQVKPRHVKRAMLAELLLATITSTAPGEKLDEKLAALVLDLDTGDRMEPFSVIFSH